MSISGASPDPLQQSLDELISAAEQYRKQSSDPSSYNAKYDLMAKATRLLHTIRGPADMVFANFEHMTSLGAIRTLLEAGVFHAIPTGGESISATEIAAKTGVDKEIIVRLMRALTPVGPFLETAEEHYAHTPFSEIYLVPQMIAVFNLMVDEYNPAMLRTYEFLRQHNWQNKIGLRSNPYTLAHNCEGKTMFEEIYESPARYARLSDAMVAQDSALRADGVYPWMQELSSLARDDKPTIVDVGGGRGHVLEQIKKAAPDLKGRFILQDLPSVIEGNGNKLVPYGIESMAHDFFDPQPIKGALVYHARRVFHDWPDDEVIQGLKNLAAVMDENSRVLITEFIMPEVGATMANAYMDLTMMTFGGVERTEKNFAHILEVSGLKLRKIWRAPGVPVGVVEGRLK
ncbi:O-methyltransferase [Aspergillus leporis]|uniref:O-methyltransferase n=1 Tax=Aspergillus leporis TaxID=41062 RepID=A0A5N5WP76_9EURO|nr:O-methyltransferase [Aspergillus leporis]